MISGRTRVLALLGNPVRHSLSPAIQNPAFQAAGVEGVYVAIRCDTGDVPGLIRGIARAGGGGNVTLPHKETAARMVDRSSEWVRLTGACNTFWLEDDLIRGENTDVAGFRGAVVSLIGTSSAGLRVLVVGAGGAARAALAGLLADGAGEVVICNRTPSRAARLSREIGDGSARVVTRVSEAGPEPFDLVVNATSLGLSEADPLPFDPAEIRESGAILDLVYRPDETALVKRSRELGIPSADGGEMLVLQGAEGFRIWWNQAPPVTAMRAALARARRHG
jgi:shikimate dehydrogenase